MADTKERDRIDASYEDGAGRYLSTSSDLDKAESDAVTDQKSGDMTSPDSHTKDGRGGDPGGGSAGAQVKDKEETPWANSVSGKPALSPTTTPMQSFLRITKEKGPMAGIGAFLITAIMFMFIQGVGQFSFLVGPSSLFADTNDTATPSMRRAFGALFQNMHDVDDRHAICNTSPKKIKCKSGRISNSGLNRMAKNGLVAQFEDGSLYDGKTKRGYPDKSRGKIVGYQAADGSSSIPANRLKEYLGSDADFRTAAKIVGVRGAFNLKRQAWIGKHIKSKLYNPLSMLRKGGQATGRTSKVAAAERKAEMTKGIRALMPSGQSASTIKARAASKVNKQMGKYKKGGIGYLVAAGGCAALGSPKFIVAGVAAIQLAQISPMVMEWALSPGDRMKADGLDYGEGITEHDAEFIGSAFNERVPNEDGELKSAMESRYLMSAMGINMGTLPVNPFAPGASALSNTAISTAMAFGDNPAVAGGCAVITNPITMWSAAVADTAITALLAPTVIGTILKIAATWLAVQAFMELAEGVISAIAADVIESFVTDNEEALANARGEQFGDAIGGSALAFFAAGGMARLLPTVSVSQLSKWKTALEEDRDLQRRTDIATLSPFDTSSRYTFLGSISYHMQLASLQQGHTGIHIPSVLSAAISPSKIMSTASASSGYGVDNCDPSYAAEAGLDTGDPATTPALNSMLLPCTGYLANMDITEAIEILENEGWVDPEVESERDDLILEELMPSDTEDGYEHGIGYIKPDNPLYEFINSCGNPASGDHILNTSGCILHDPSTSGIGAINGQVCKDSESGEECRELSGLDDAAEINEGALSAEDLGVKDPRAFQAISAFTLQYQMAQSINGEDDGPVTVYTGPADGVNNVSQTPQVPQDGGLLPGEISSEWVLPTTGTVTSDYGPRWGRQHNGVDIASPIGTPLYAAAAGIATRHSSTNRGNIVSIDHGGGIVTHYYHLNSYDIPAGTGTQVAAGQLIGKMGNTGNSTGPHLHFETRINSTNWDNGTAVEPREFMRQRGVTIPPRNGVISSIGGS